MWFRWQRQRRFPTPSLSFCVTVPADLIQAAVAAEFEEYLSAFETETLADGRRPVVRNGHLPERQILTGSGAVDVQVPKARNRAGARDNLAQAKALGAEHVVFHKKSGLKPTDITTSSWLYDQLKRFRAGIEAGISYLKRCFGLARCRWRGLAHFKAYVHSAIFTHNLARLERLRPRPGGVHTHPQKRLPPSRHEDRYFWPDSF